MTTGKTSFLNRVALGALVLGLAVCGASIRAQHAQPKTQKASVAGKWTVAVAADTGTIEASAVFEQHDEKVTGTFTSDHTGEAAVTGRFVDGTLTFSVAVHADTQPMSVDFTGKFNDDGTLAGTVLSPMGELKWTATRVK